MKKLARFLGLGNEKMEQDKPVLTHLEHIAETAAVIESCVENAVEIQTVAIETIVPNPFQPRKIFNDEALQELSSSIREYGIIQPLLVRRTDAGFELIAGERRLRASKLAGLTEVPVIIRVLDDKEMAELAMIENLQREDLHFLEEALGYQTLLFNFGLTQDELARRLGKSQSTIANKLRLLKLPGDVQTILVDDNLTERHARSLLKIEDPAMQMEILNSVRQKGMNVRETENYIEEVLEDISREMAKKNAPKQNVIKIIRDARIFINTINKVVTDIKKTGLNVMVKQDQDDDYVTINLRIPKRK
ncbi:nucleoid occlusion protein [Anaerospora sp.]|jgi:ParB family chromosome partitioning protein|uniref:nucleoid occlusion protein n=1 Tax=Anaerospora sp. TaxID=1960278 RepID=UPI00289698D7|nr:nucleoid occlusion protein [Anaerospora sp.]